MSVDKYDVIVIGVGSMGSACCYQLAKRGYKVLGLDQFTIPHENGSHAGQSRIIRKAYFEHRDYVPLLHRAYSGWKELEDRTGEQVYFETGLLYHGPSDHPVIKGVKEAAELYRIEIRNISAERGAVDYPQFSFVNSNETLSEPGAGFLLPGKAISLLVNEAIKKRAEIKTGEQVLEWKKDKDLVKVSTDKNTYYSRKLIITAGAWAGKIIPQLKTALKVTRQVVLWVKPDKVNDFGSANFPCWLIADHQRGGALYGFPYLPEEKYGEPGGLKIAWHFPGDETEPAVVNRQVTATEIDRLIRDVAEYIPAVRKSTIVAAKTCLYANSEDENFIIDHLSGHDGDITIACGFSGHGFKFVPVIGEVLADLAMEGTTKYPVDFLKLERFQSKI